VHVRERVPDSSHMFEKPPQVPQPPQDVAMQLVPFVSRVQPRDSVEVEPTQLPLVQA
jgi:hypothetical protein